MKALKQPKILVLSHNCFSEVTANGRTLSSFFRKWDKDNVAQIYINNELPNSSVTNRFFRITDADILKSLVTVQRPGNIMQNISTLKSKKVKERVKKKYSHILQFIPSLIYLTRDAIWETNRWNTIELNNWIDAFEPDIILLQPGDYSFIYKIAMKISIDKRIPIVIYNSEDYYLKNRFSFSPLFYIQRYLFKNTVRKVVNKSKIIIYSNDLLNYNLHKHFNSQSTVILTSSEMKPSIHQTSGNKELRIIYAGNLGHERWSSLVTIGKSIKNINRHLSIEVYSGDTLSTVAEKQFSFENGIDFKGYVDYADLLEIINQSDIVIHTEGFSNFTKWDIRHGFSTKIGDLLSSGKCFLMYGPKEISCVDYLMKNQAAWVATSESELNDVLKKILSSIDERNKFLLNAKKLVEERHDLDKNCILFEELMSDVYLNHKKII